MTSFSGIAKFRVVPSLVFAGLLLAACATAPARPPASVSTGQPRPDPIPATRPDPTPPPVIVDPGVVEPVPGYRNPAKFVTPEHMRGRDIRRVGVLLPFSHSSSGTRAQATGLLTAIEMALFEQNDSRVVLLPKDTGGDARTTAKATEELIDEGVDVIIGPLFAENVRMAASLTRIYNIPVIAFSNDREAARSGAYLMSFPPEEEVRRIVDYTILNGVNRFAFMGPNTDYARRVQSALSFEASRRGGAVIGSEFFDPSNDAPVDEAQRLAARIKQVLDGGANKVAIVMPDKGTRLRAVAPLMPYYGVNLLRLQYVGTSVWDDPTIWREPVLENATFAAPSPSDIRIFNDSYKRNFAREPSSLASLGYDAAALAISFLSDGVVEDAELRDPDGFRGVNGLFRFRPDGTIERGLSVLAISQRGPREIESAPNSFFPDVN